MENQPIRLIIADDHAIFRDGLRRLLATQPDFQVIGEASDGKEAISLAQSMKPDVLLLDLAMPRVSGWQVARAVKQVAPHVPVFLVTGFGVELSAEERRTHGVDLVLVKPLQIQEILDAVAEVARSRPA